MHRLETAVSTAIKEATDTACKWGAPVNRDNRAAGGVHFSTYKVSAFRALIRLSESAKSCGDLNFGTCLSSVRSKD